MRFDGGRGRGLVGCVIVCVVRLVVGVCFLLILGLGLGMVRSLFLFVFFSFFGESGRGEWGGREERADEYSDGAGETEGV